jgi:hypothetical protein
MTEGAQPDAGQGAGGLYDSVLQFVPEDRHQEAVPHLQELAKGVNTKLEDAAEFRKAWEPYESIEGLRDYGAEDLQGLIGWHQQVYSNPEAARQWWETFGNENGWSLAEQEEAQADLEADGFTPEQAQNMLAPLQQQLEAQAQQMEQLEWDRNADVEADAMHAEITRLASERGLGELTPEQRAIVYELGMAYAVDGRGQELPVGDTSWVAKGLDRFQSIYTEGQRAFVEDKSKGPASVLTKGATEQAKPITSFEEANKAMRERWAASRG